MHLIDDGIISLSLHSDHAVVVSISYKYVVRKGCNIEGVVPAFIFNRQQAEAQFVHLQLIRCSALATFSSCNAAIFLANFPFHYS